MSPTCLICQVSKLCYGLCSGEYSIKKEVEVLDGKQENVPEYSKYYQDGIVIHDLKQLVGRDHEEF